MENADEMPEGFVRFDMLRNTENPDEVISFGFFDGSVEQLREVASKEGYEEQLERIALLRRVGRRRRALRDRRGAYSVEGPVTGSAVLGGR